MALDPQTGRLHTTFNQTVASTGRLSSSNPNLQNIPVRTELGGEIRACFVAEEGRRLVVADYSQIELRLMAFLAQEPALLEAYRRGEDVHRVTAAAVAGIPQEQVTKRQRERAKATNFGIMYGLSAYGLSEQVDMDVEEARAFIDAYFAKYPKVKEFRERVIAQATQDGHVTTVFGRRRALPELRSPNQRERSLGERLAVNTVLQGSAADIIKVAMVEATRRARARRSGLAARAAGARRAGLRVPRSRSGRGRAADPPGHVRRLSDGPAARGEHRRRRQLARRQVSLPRRRASYAWLVLYSMGLRPGRGSLGPLRLCKRRTAVRRPGGTSTYMTKEQKDTKSEEPIELVEGSDGYLKIVDGEIVPNYDATINIFTEGDIVTGKVVRIDKDEVLVDIGYKSEGVIPVSELTIRKSVNTADEVALGEEIDALVMQKEDADGRLILTKKRAKFEKAWKRIEEAFESGQPVQGNVIEVVKGGLILDLGVRGFLPASLVDIRRVQDLQEYVGQELNCRVIEMNRNRNNVVLSRRAVLEEERKEVRQQIIDELKVGDIVEGTISNIVDFGAFVDLDGIDGLIHISELSWTHINHPSEVLQVNQKVKVKVLDIDRDRQRIRLGLKQTQEDPWQKIVAAHRVGDVVEGRVTKIVAFGAFVEIYEGIEGLVHISELANRHVERPDEVVSVGQHVSVKIIEIDSERRRLSLSIKRVEGEGEVKPDRPYVPPTPKAEEAEEAEEAEAEGADVAEA